MKNCFLMSLMFIVFAVGAQNKSIELNQQGYTVGTVFRIISTPKINWMKNKHQIGIGPTFLLFSKFGRFISKEFQPVGLQQSYRFTPNKSDTRLNFFVFQELTLQLINHTWETHEWNSDGKRYDEFKYINSEFLGLLNIGYGLEFKLTKRFFLKQSVGIGLYYSFSDSNEISPDAPELLNEDVNINGYPNFGYTYGLSAGLEYKF